MRNDGGGPDGALPRDAAGADSAPGDGPNLDASGDAGAQADGQRDSAAQADGQKDSAPQQDSGPQCTTQNLLVNGNFDVGPGSGWVAYSD